jgi:hypothetical protein
VLLAFSEAVPVFHLLKMYENAIYLNIQNRREHEEPYIAPLPGRKQGGVICGGTHQGHIYKIMSELA